MKEFVLIPVSDYKRMQESQQKCDDKTKSQNDNNNMQEHMKHITSNSNISSDSLLKMLSSLQDLDRRAKNYSKADANVIPANDDHSIKKEKNTDDDMLETILNFIPSKLRAEGKELARHLLESNIVKSDNIGYITVDKETFRLENLLKAILIKNSSIRTLKPALIKLVHNIPKHLILNKKVLNLMSEDTTDARLDMSNNNNADEMDSSILTGSGKLKSKTFIPPPVRNKTINWIHY